MRDVRLFASTLAVSAVALVVVACGSSDEPPPGVLSTRDSGAPPPAEPTADSGSEDSGAPTDAGAEASDAGDAGKVLPDGLFEPVIYKSRADSPFAGVTFESYDHFEDWEDGLVDTPGVTPSSTTLGSAFGTTLIDSVDGDDGVVDGKCQKTAGTCNSGFANGSIDFVFDAATLGELPTHVGIAWTDGATGCDAVFEAFDANDVSLGVKTASAVGDGSNVGTVDEDRYFAVVHRAGVKKIVVKSSSGGVEVDHLHYGR